MSTPTVDEALASAEAYRIIAPKYREGLENEVIVLADAYHEKDLALTLVCSEVNQLKARAVMFAHEFQEFCASCGIPLPHNAGSHIHIARQGCFVCGLPSDDLIHMKES